MSLVPGASDRSPRLSNTVGGGASQAGRSRGTGNVDSHFIRLSLVRALQMHRRLALGIALAGLILALAYVATTWPVYTAQSQIYVRPIQSKVLTQGNEQTPSMNPTAFDSYVQQQVQNATNPEVLSNALHKLRAGAWQQSNENEQAAADRLGRSIKVARVGASDEVAISARAKDPGLAAQIANAVATSVIERATKEENAGDAQRIDVLREERDRIRYALQADYAEQDALNKQLGMAAVGTTVPDLIDDQIAKTREELIKAQADHDQAEARFAAMKVGEGNSSAAISAEADDLVAADPGMTSMKTTLNQRRAVLISQMANLAPDNPAYKQDVEELAKINGALDSMMNDLRTKAVDHIEEKLRTELERTADVEAKLNGRLHQLAQAAASATPKLQRLNDLAAGIARLRDRYATVEGEVNSILLEDRGPGWVHLSMAAVPPLHPTISGILERAMWLALGGLILGVVVAVVVYRMDPRVYIAADVERVLGMAPLAVLPDFEEVSDGAAGEHILRLSAAIEQASKRWELKSCIFTGAAPGVGVTTLASRVRDTLVTIGRPTVLLDASGASDPAARESVGTGLQDQSPGLTVTQRGNRSSALLKQVEAQVTHQEGLVLTDTAPLTISAETEHLARSVDGAIVVIESGVTTRDQLLNAMRALRRLDVGIVGVVLNRVRLGKADSAFRRSIQDIETHVRAHGISSSLRPVPTEQISEQPGRGTDLAVNKPEMREGAARVAEEAAPERAHRGLLMNASDWSGVTPALASLTHRTARSTQDPLWRREEPVQEVTEVSRPAEGSDVAPARSAPIPRPEPLPGWFWDVGSSGSGGGSEESGTVEKEKPVEGKNPFEAESRLNGLRGLILTLELKKLNMRRESAPVGAESSSAETPAPEANIAGSEVTAQPEILPPKEFVPMSETKRAREEGDDDIRILPAKRGQYRSKG